MSEESTRIYVKNGNKELELKGSQSFVSDKFEELLDKFEFSRVDQNKVEQKSDKTPKEQEGSINNDKLKPILKELEMTESNFLRSFEVDEELPPRVLEGDKVPGGSDRDLMENGALILATLWRKCYGKEWISGSEMKEALNNSHLPNEHFGDVYKRSSFSKHFKEKGERKGKKIKVNRRGMDEAIEIMKEIAVEEK